MGFGEHNIGLRRALPVAEYIWRVRERFAAGESPMPDEAVRRAREAIAQGVDGFYYAALRDERALASLAGRGVEPGDPFDMEVGGFTGPQAGEPVRIRGTVRCLGPRWGYDHIAVIEFGDDPEHRNLLVLTPAYEQVR